MLCLIDLTLIFFTDAKYYYMNVTENVKNWPDARQDCIDMGKKLFEIRSETDLAFAYDAYNRIFGDVFWVGVKYVSNQYVYDSNGETYVGFWADGRPLYSVALNAGLFHENGLQDWPSHIRTTYYICEWP